MESVICRTIRNKSSTFGVRGRVECAYYWCFNKVPVYFWLNFKLNREQEIAVESMIKTYLSCCQLHMGRVNCYKRIWLQAGNCSSKVTENQVCVLNKHKLSQFFFGKTLLTTDIARACCLYEKASYNFPEKSELPKFILPVKIYWLILFCGFRGGNKNNCRDQSRLFFSSCDFAVRFRATPQALVLQCEPARRLTYLQVDWLFIAFFF